MSKLEILSALCLLAQLELISCRLQRNALLCCSITGNMRC